MSELLLDAEALYLELKKGVQRLLTPDTALVGIWSGGAWAAERLAADLGVAAGTISSALHRDDFGSRGLAKADHTTLPFDVNGRDILLIDDVLYTGRTTRAVMSLTRWPRPSTTVWSTSQSSKPFHRAVPIQNAGLTKIRS